MNDTTKEPWVPAPYNPRTITDEALVAKPQNSQITDADIIDSQTMNPYFLPDVIGDYTLSLFEYNDTPVFLENSTINISNSVFEHNNFGRAISLYYSSAVLDNLILSGQMGMGLESFNSQILLTNSTITGNASGGIYLDENSTGNIDKCIININELKFEKGVLARRKIKGGIKKS